MRVVVTGSSGQLGSLVLRRLIDDPRVTQILALDRVAPRLDAPKLRAVICDVRDPDLGSHFEPGRWDVLVHLAFLVTAQSHRDEYVAVNVGGSKNAIATAVRAGVHSVVYLSSVAAYGPQPAGPVVTEQTPRRRDPSFAYAQTKYDVEAWLDEELEPAHPGVAVARLRPGIFVGRRMAHPAARALAARFLISVGGERVSLPVVWDEDVADAVTLAIHHRAAGAFNLVAEPPANAAELARAGGMHLVRVPLALASRAAELYAWLGRHGFGRGADPAWVRAGGSSLYVTARRAREELGWAPSCPAAVDVMRRFDREVPRVFDPRLIAFFKLSGLAMGRAAPLGRAEGLRGNVHLQLTGRDGGDVTLSVERGRMAIAIGAPELSTSTVTLSTEVLRELLAGEADVARASLTGLVRLEGAPSGTACLGDLVAGFRARVDTGGPAGRIARGLERVLLSRRTKN